MDKKVLRKVFLEKRAALDPENRRNADRRITECVESLAEFQEASLVGGYVTDGTEPDVLEILHHALDLGKKICLPKWDGRKYVMVLTAETNIKRLAPGHFGLLEPLETMPAFPETGKKVLFLVPGVAFDESFARLGRGGGIYDRLLKQWEGASSIGIFYECQKSPGFLPAEEHDVKMDLIVTESAVRKKH